MANKNKLMEKAQKLLQKGKIRETIAALNQVIDVDPTDFRVLLKKSELESRLGDISAAKESYNRVAEQYSNDGFYLKAIAIYKKILKLDPNEVGIYSKLAQLYRKLGLDTEAKKHLKVVAEYYKVKGMRTNYQEIVVQLSELGEMVSDSQMSMVESFVKEGDRDRAIEQFRAMSEKFHEGGNISQLDLIVKKMDELQIKDLDVYIMQAKLYVGGKEPKKALQVIQKAYALDPQNTNTLELLAKCFVELAQPTKAMSVYNELAKIYDRNGDMRGLARIKSEMVQADDPVAQLNEVEEEVIQDDEGEQEFSYQTGKKEESEEFVIEEVEEISAPINQPQAAMSVDEELVEEVQEEPMRQAAPESSISELNNDLLDDDDDDDSFTRGEEEEKDPNNLSFMNVFVDAFDKNEDTVMLDSDEDIKRKKSKAAKSDEGHTRPLDPSENMGAEESIAFQSSSSFEFSPKDVAEATRLDQPAKPLGTKTGTMDPFREEAPALGKQAKQDLVDFDKFYSSGTKEKSEISVYEEEFVSVSDLLDEASGPSKPKPEKIEVHDVVEISHPMNLEKGLSADIESSLDFSNISSVNELDEPSQNSKDIMNMMLSDVEPEEEAEAEDANQHVHLDEKTMIDLKQEFKENANNEPSEQSFFDLSEELKDEIQEFEKNFGKPEEEAEEEYLSPEEVILEFKKGIARTIDKNDFQTHYNLGVAYKEMGLIDEAISAFELASGNQESKADAISMIGICLAIKNDFEGAVKLYQQVIPTMSYQDPKCLGLTYQLGEAFLELKRHVEAYKAFSRIKDVDPTFRDVKARVKELGFNLGIQEQDPQQYAGKIVVDLKNRKKNKI